MSIWIQQPNTATTVAILVPCQLWEDIKDLITLEDVMEEMELGPNGALLFCMEYLLQSQEWINEQLGEVVHQDDYVIFDCPGQIELFNDQNIFRELCKFLQDFGKFLLTKGFLSSPCI